MIYQYRMIKHFRSSSPISRASQLNRSYESDYNSTGIFQNRRYSNPNTENKYSQNLNIKRENLALRARLELNLALNKKLKKKQELTQKVSLVS